MGFDFSSIWNVLRALDQPQLKIEVFAQIQVFNWAQNVSNQFWLILVGCNKPILTRIRDERVHARIFYFSFALQTENVKILLFNLFQPLQIPALLVGTRYCTFLFSWWEKNCLEMGRWSFNPWLDSTFSATSKTNVSFQTGLIVRDLQAVFFISNGLKCFTRHSMCAQKW